MLSNEGLIVGLITALCSSTFALTSRYVVKDTSSPLAFSLLFTIFAAIVSLGILFIEPLDFTTTSLWFTFLLLVAAGLYGVFDITQFSARKHMEASSLAIVLQVAPVIAFVLSVALLKESVTATKLLAVGLIICGNIVAIYKSLQITRIGLLFSLAMAASLGFAYVVDKVTFPHIPFAVYSVTVYIIPAIIVYIVFKLRGGTRAEIETVWRENTWHLPLMSLLAVITYYMVFQTFALLDASVAVPLIASSTVLTVLGGILILGEKGNVLRKVIGVALVISGVLLLRL